MEQVKKLGYSFYSKLNQQNLPIHKKMFTLYAKENGYSVSIKDISDDAKAFRDFVMDLKREDDGVIFTDRIAECKNDTYDMRGDNAGLIHECSSVTYFGKKDGNIDPDKVAIEWNEKKQQYVGKLMWPGSEKYQYTRNFIAENCKKNTFKPGLCLTNPKKIKNRFFLYLTPSKWYAFDLELLNKIGINGLDKQIKDFPLLVTPNEDPWNGGYCSINIKIKANNFGKSLLSQIDVSSGIIDFSCLIRKELMNA